MKELTSSQENAQKGENLKYDFKSFSLNGLQNARKRYNCVLSDR